MFGHPRGLTILFLTEMWEKFSYYGMRALLVYYMTKELSIPQERASLVYGAYIAAAYFTPIPGGIISDRWLGRRRAVLIGGSIMALGHFMMAFDGLFYPALATIAIGNGLYLPTLPGQIGELYDRDDPRRISAYNVYYAGVNLGGFLAPLVCGALGELYGWHWGFGAAGVGMVCGLLTYAGGSRWLPADTNEIARRARGLHPSGEPGYEALTGNVHESAHPREDVGTPEGRSPRLYLLLGAILAAVVVFRGAYEQVGNTVALWADNGVDRSVGTHAIPMTWFPALNSLLVFVLTPIIVARWSRLARQGRQTSSAVKMSAGAATVAASYLVLAAVSTWYDARGARTSWLWLAAFFFLLTAGELYILPVGLALFGRLAPANMAATLMAIWFSAICLGNLLAGVLGTLWSRLSPAGFFALMSGVAGVSALALIWLDVPVREMERRTVSDTLVSSRGLRSRTR